MTLTNLALKQFKMNKNKKLLIVGSLSLVSASLFSISSSVSYSKRESTTNKNFNNLNNYKFLYKFTEQNLKMDYKIRTLTKTENKTLNYYDAKIKKNDSWGINRHIAVGRTKGYSNGYYTSSNEILKHRPFVGFSNADNHLNMNLSYKTGTSMIDYESMINKVDKWGWLYKNGTYSIKEDYMSDTSLEDNIFNLNKNLFDIGYYSFLEKNIESILLILILILCLMKL
ncbi:hypothetical protein [Mycoplasmopsis adleri]|uniref:hypothetical protein n=1 Tax=Mycoplasmopsis adleri TaxID=51362 RepID=UPI00387303D8